MTRVRCTIVRDWTGGQLANAVGMKIDLSLADATRLAEDGCVTIDTKESPIRSLDTADAPNATEHAIAVGRPRKSR